MSSQSFACDLLWPADRFFLLHTLRSIVVETMFEDDGNVASGTTVAAYDVRTRKLYLSGEFPFY